MDLLYKVIIVYLFFKTSSPEYTGVLTRLWPLDSQTCSSEVFTTSYVYSECNNTFEDQPQDFPFNAMAFDGSSFIDVAVDVSTTKIKHYSFQGWFVFKTETPSSLFHYRDSQGITETIVWIKDMKLKLYRKVKSNVKKFTGGQQLSKYKWYFIALGVGEVGYVSLRIDGVRDVYGMLNNRNSKELPGTLRIGGDFGETHANVEGRITCVGFHLNTRNVVMEVVKDVCNKTSWMHVESYHMETDFFPLHSTINSEPELCNATYSARNITRQIATKPNITGTFTILCNISDNNRTTNDTLIQACVDVFTDIEINFSCYGGNDRNIETLNITSSFPYDNITLVIHNCSQPEINYLKLLYESNDDYNRSDCEGISKKAMINCSVGCTGNICSINTRCVHEIDLRCLIPRYMFMYVRIIYECVHHSSETNPATPPFTMHHKGTTKPIHVPSSTEMTIARIPDLTTAIVFDDSSTTSKEEITKAEPVSVGPIIGSIVGSIALVAIFVVLAVYFRRVHIMKHKTNGQSEGMVDSLIRQNSLKDYTGVQMVAYPGEGNAHLTNEMYTEISDDPRVKFKSDQKENCKGKGRDIDIDSGNFAGGYTLAKPIANKLQLLKIQLEMTQTDSGYSMAKQISTKDNYGGNCTQSSSDLVASNDYEDSPEGVYDQSKTRINMNDVDVYDRATDGTYDTANHCTKQRTEDDDIAYDHFTGPKTIDNYELVMRHNKVVSDDTYGGN